ncbi:MAG TPA: hypothetical protein VHQ41_01430 [Patescibacteria group bacterium]|jgi:hypothetical protein|nr:hypothetical protein [Patescibacteria group bacterium]
MAADIGYILPHSDRSDLRGEKLNIVRVGESDSQGWRIFKDQLDYALERMAKYDNFICQFTLKQGTTALIHTLEMRVGGEVVLTFGGESLELKLPKLREIYESADADFIDDFEYMTGILFG